MLRLVLIVVIAMTTLVFLRLVLLRFRVNLKHTASSSSPFSSAPQFPGPGELELRGYSFAGFEKRSGPKDPEDFYERMAVHIGRAGEQGFRSYSLFAASPRGIENSLQRGFPGGRSKLLRNLLIVKRYDADLVEQALREHLDQIVQWEESGG